MTVGELIAALGKYKADLPVLVWGRGDSGLWPPTLGPAFIMEQARPNGEVWIVPADPNDDGAYAVVSIS